jgi:hypothetical protein
MSDIFLSYAREDHEHARMVAEALEGRGYSVWWDRNIVASENWLRKIEDAVHQAKCVVVLWTPRSVNSDWVREEASLAREAGKILPVLLENAEIPLSFRLIQTADLRDWGGEEDHPGLREVEAGVRARLESTPAGVSPVQKRNGAVTRGARWQLAISLAWLLLPSAVVALCAIGLMYWRAPAKVEIEATARRAQFRTSGKVQLLQSIRARSLAIRGFDQVRLAGAEVRIADPARYDLRLGTYPDDAWTRLPLQNDLVLRPAGETIAATLTIEPVAKSAGLLVLDRIFAGPAEVTLESPEKHSLAISLRGLNQAGTVSLPEAFRLVAGFCTKEGVPWLYSAQSVTMLVRLPQNPLLEFSPAAGSGISFVVDLRLGDEAFLAESGVVVDEVKFHDLGPTGQPLSTLAGGAIRYEEHPGVDPVILKPGDFLVLDDLRQFRLLDAVLAEQNRLQLRLHGIAGKFSSGPSGFVHDRRLTYFDILWRSPKLAALFTILIWVVPTLVAGRRFLVRPG